MFIAAYDGVIWVRLMEAINAPPVFIHGAKYDKIAHHYELKGVRLLKEFCCHLLLKVFWFQQYYL